ncbi:MAG: c-type cytochrome [Halothiobacillus sp.]
MAVGNAPKTDSNAKFAGFIAAILLLAAVYYLVSSLVSVVNRSAFKGEFVEPPVSSSAPSTTVASGTVPATPAPVAVVAVASSSGNAAEGKTAYATCAACHGADGKGNGGAFPNLTKLNAADAEAILTAFKKGDMDYLKKRNLGGARYSTMAPQAAGLTDAAIANLAAYIAELGGHTAEAAATAPAAVATAAPAQANTAAVAGGAPAAAPAAAAAAPKMVSSEIIALGHSLYSSCAVCHGAEGEGARLFQAPKLAGLPYSSVVSLLGLYRKGQQMGANSYAMIPQAKNLTDDEIDALANYIAVINTPAAHGAAASD